MLLTLFPFEAPLFEKAGVAVRYVGHPLADLLEELPSIDEVREELRISTRIRVVAMLPGSRVSELENMAELFVRTAVKLSELVPGIRFLVPFATRETRILFEQAIASVAPAELNLTIMTGHSLEAMAASDAVLVASGTATLEAALLKRPMVITYKVSRLSYWVLRRRAYQPFLGLPNILAGEAIVPELIQDAATPETLAQALFTLLNDADARSILMIDSIRFGTPCVRIRPNRPRRRSCLCSRVRMRERGLGASMVSSASSACKVARSRSAVTSGARSAQACASCAYQAGSVSARNRHWASIRSSSSVK